MGLPSLEVRCGRLYLWGVRTTWHTEGGGEFHCERCGGDRGYLRRAGVRRFTLLNVPVLRRAGAGAVAECTTCHHRYDLAALEPPTAGRLADMLRDAVHAMALAVLTAGGAGSRAVRETALTAVREAGFADCTEEQLIGLLAALAADEGRLPGSGCADAVDGCGTWLSTELHQALEPLSAHLAPAGRARILLQGARIALADGSYQPAERSVLAAVGRSLCIAAPEVADLLAAAERAPS